MGLLDIFSKPDGEVKFENLPRGSFTVNPSGKLLASTLPQSYPEALMREIASTVQAAFQEAREAGQPLHELHVNFGSLKLTAREQRGGAMIFLAPTG